ncbi:MAG: ClC family H(+)/Cl(-) exchange transporter [Clostridiales bacterium]|nr:ClC family H(+)/Cl(-) exchange transporter [Clostridiales bacterium]
MKVKFNRIGKKAYGGAQIIAVGTLTGLFVGITITLYTLLTTMAEEFSRGYYAFFRNNPAFIPLLFVALFLGSIIIGGMLRFLPMIRGSGIPQTEGATRGMLRYKWYEVLTGMFAASLFTIFMGLSAGGEGPSIMMGGACGCGTSDLLKRNALIRRYQITGGACAGLAVALNAPLAGMAFAFEEAHKRFTPEVFVCAFSSVISATVVNHVLRMLMGLSTGAAFSAFSFAAIEEFDLMFLLYVLLASCVCALAGVGFYFLTLQAKKLFRKLNFWKGFGGMVIPFMLAGVCGLITVYAMGGGHEFIVALGNFDTLERVFSSPLWATLLIVVVLKFAVTVVNVGAGVPCGAFIPMLAIGAGLGGLLSLLCSAMGMDPAYSDALVLICMAAVFPTIVKAPITGTVMVVELTWNFMFLLPVILGTAIGYVVGSIFHTEPIYEVLLEDFLEKDKNKQKITVRLLVTEDGQVADRAVRDILWPQDMRVVLVRRGEEQIVPDGNTRLLVGDLLYAECRTSDEKEVKEALRHIAGTLLEEEDGTV